MNKQTIRKAISHVNERGDVWETMRALGRLMKESRTDQEKGDLYLLQGRILQSIGKHEQGERKLRRASRLLREVTRSTSIAYIPTEPCPTHFCGQGKTLSVFGLWYCKNRSCPLPLIYAPSQPLEEKMKFFHGRARVRENHSYFFIDTQEHPINEERYDYADHFSEERALVMKHGKYFFIDADGHPISDKKYDYAESFSKGRAYVEYHREKDEEGFFIDKQGQRIT